MAQKRNATKTKGKPAHNTTAVRGLFVLSGAFAVLLSLLSFAYVAGPHNWIGLVGFTVGKTLHFLFGLGGYILCLYFGWVGWRLLFSKPINHPIIKALYVFVLITSMCVLLALLEDRFPSFASLIGNAAYPNLWHKKIHYHLGGSFFYYFYRDLPVFNLYYVFNTTGVALLCLSTFLASLLFLTKASPANILKAISNGCVRFWKALINETNELECEVQESDPSGRYVALRTTENQQSAPATKGSSTPSQEMLEIEPETNLTVRPSLSHKAQTERKKAKESPTPAQAPNQISKEQVGEVVKKKRQSALAAQRVHNGDFKEYILPPPSLLTTPKKVDSSSLKQNLKRQAEVLEETLLSFGIEAKVGQINCGPSITSFEVHPAIGVKVQKIKALENDIALNMEAKSIRIIAPIPGKAAVGIEVPNPTPQEVGFKDLLTSYQQGSRKFNIPVLLGKAVNGDNVFSDLSKMPHCIIAGATGSGKSVCINTLIMSIVMNARPDEIKLVMVDPKKVELTGYTRLPHMLAPVITGPQGAAAALNWLVKEMENRYEILKQLGVRNLEAFNNRTINAELEASLDREIPQRLPHIVIIIDELADLMMIASNDIETPIVRIAQMARAIGIHLVLATQRPSREVITGLIKANFPTRIAFKVASRVNSQIILDEVGAESLLGNGDMLFLPPGSSITIRSQGAFIRDEDISAVVKFICDQAPPNYVISSFDDLAQDTIPETTALSDSLYDQAKQIVTSSGNTSTTFLQRKLKIGYSRAASLIDELESKGVISSSNDGNNKQQRQVIATQAHVKTNANTNGKDSVPRAPSKGASSLLDPLLDEDSSDV